MIRDLGVQLYSLREDSEKDFPGVLKFVADTGYKAVEPAGFYNYTPREFKKACDDLDLRIASAHALGLDSVADVPREGIRRSYAYLTENRLGVGSK